MVLATGCEPDMPVWRVAWVVRPSTQHRPCICARGTKFEMRTAEMVCGDAGRDLLTHSFVPRVPEHDHVSVAQLRIRRRLSKVSWVTHQRCPGRIDRRKNQVQWGKEWGLIGRFCFGGGDCGRAGP